MATGFSVSETIAEPADRVWACMTDFDQADRWMHGVEQVSADGGNGLSIGTQLRFRARGREHTSQITALDPGRTLSLTSTQGSVSATYRYALTPVPDGTRITLDVDCEARGLWRPLRPLIVAAMRRSDGSQLANLKTAISGWSADESAPAG